MAACAWCGHPETAHGPTRTETWCIVGIASDRDHCPCPGYNPNSELRLKSIKDDLRSAVSDIWTSHNDRCLSSDNCSCMARAKRIEKAFGLEKEPEYHHHFITHKINSSITIISRCVYCDGTIGEKCTGPKEAGK